MNKRKNEKLLKNEEKKINEAKNRSKKLRNKIVFKGKAKLKSNQTKVLEKTKQLIVPRKTIVKKNSDQNFKAKTQTDNDKKTNKNVNQKKKEKKIMLKQKKKINQIKKVQKPEKSQIKTRFSLNQRKNDQFQNVNNSKNFKFTSKNDRKLFKHTDSNSSLLISNFNECLSSIIKKNKSNKGKNIRLSSPLVESSIPLNSVILCNSKKVYKGKPRVGSSTNNIKKLKKVDSLPKLIKNKSKMKKLKNVSDKKNKYLQRNVLKKNHRIASLNAKAKVKLLSEKINQRITKKSSKILSLKSSENLKNNDSITKKENTNKTLKNEKKSCSEKANNAKKAKTKKLSKRKLKDMSAIEIIDTRRCKRMASLNASAMMAASFLPEIKKSEPLSNSDVDHQILSEWSRTVEERIEMSPTQSNFKRKNQTPSTKTTTLKTTVKQVKMSDRVVETISTQIEQQKVSSEKNTSDNYIVLKPRGRPPKNRLPCSESVPDTSISDYQTTSPSKSFSPLKNNEIVCPIQSKRNKKTKVKGKLKPSLVAKSQKAHSDLNKTNSIVHKKTFVQTIETRMESSSNNSMLFPTINNNNTVRSFHSSVLNPNSTPIGFNNSMLNTNNNLVNPFRVAGFPLTSSILPNPMLANMSPYVSNVVGSGSTLTNVGFVNVVNPSTYQYHHQLSQHHVMDNNTSPANICFTTNNHQQVPSHQQQAISLPFIFKPLNNSFEPRSLNMNTLPYINTNHLFNSHPTVSPSIINILPSTNITETSCALLNRNLSTGAPFATFQQSGQISTINHSNPSEFQTSQIIECVNMNGLNFQQPVESSYVNRHRSSSSLPSIRPIVTNSPSSANVFIRATPLIANSFCQSSNPVTIPATMIPVPISATNTTGVVPFSLLSSSSSSSIQTTKAASINTSNRLRMFTPTFETSQQLNNQFSNYQQNINGRNHNFVVNNVNINPNVKIIDFPKPTKSSNRSITKEKFSTNQKNCKNSKWRSNGKKLNDCFTVVNNDSIFQSKSMTSDKILGSKEIHRNGFIKNKNSDCFSNADGDSVVGNRKQTSSLKLISEQPIKRNYLKPKNILEQSKIDYPDMNDEDDQKKSQSISQHQTVKKTLNNSRFLSSVNKNLVIDGNGNKKINRKFVSHGWSWEGESIEKYVFVNNNEEQSYLRKCFKAIKHVEGDVIRVRDCVLLKSGPRKTDLPFVAKIASLWETQEKEMMMSLLWYYRPEHTELQENYINGEIYASRHRDANSVACIDDKCYVLTYNQYCRYKRQKVRVLQPCASLQTDKTLAIVPSISPNNEESTKEDNILLKSDGLTHSQPPLNTFSELVFCCRKVYDFRQKRILKNPS